MNTYGWDSVNTDISTNYITKCALFGSNNIAFSNFKQDDDYCTILEGKNHLTGLQSLERIDQLHSDGREIIKQNLKKFNRNDIYGTPTLYNYEVFGTMSPGSTVYVSNLLDIYKFVGNKVGRIVEIGGGYGGMCVITDALIQFDEYILIDLPEVISLCKKYLSNFPDIINRVKFITCEELKSIEKIENVDLFIASASLAECNLETQMEYVNKILKYSKYGYIVYNTMHLGEGVDSFYYILTSVETLFDFKIDTSNYNIRFVYLRRK